MKPELQNSFNQVKRWLILKGSGVPFIVGFGAVQWTYIAAQRYPEVMVMPFCGLRGLKEGSEGYFFVPQESYFQSAKKLFDNPALLERIYSDFLKDEKLFLDTIKEIEAKGDEFFYNNFKKFVHAYDAEYSSGIIPDGVMIYGDVVVDDIKKKYPGQEEKIALLIQSYGQTFFEMQQLDLYSIALKSKTYKTTNDLFRDQPITKALGEHQIKFHWIMNNYKKADPLPVEFFVEQLFELFKKKPEEIEKEYERLKDYSKEHQKKCEEIKNEDIFLENDFNKLLWIGKVVWWIDRRKKYNLIANYYLTKYLRMVCESYHLLYEDAQFLLPWELSLVVEGKRHIEDFPIEERKRGGVYVHDNQNNWEYIVGEEAINLWRRISPEVNDKDIKELKGQIACKGIVKGKVRVVYDPHKLEEFGEGDILVAGMTRPDFLGLMRKAAAFVTDEGGVTCHAAIVAREMQKPCIIGTKIATQVLKDGDVVEVDANQGIVRILKR